MANVFTNPMSRSPVWVSEPASVASVDYLPTGGAFRALNCSAAGLLTLVKGDGSQVAEYMNTGWNPTSGTKVLAAGAAATLVAAAIDR